jgi:hypothetical protein
MSRKILRRRSGLQTKNRIKLCEKVYSGSHRPSSVVAIPGSALQPAATTAITFQNNTDVPAIATVRWGDIDVGNCGAAAQGACGVGTELVWYDVYVKRADTNALLASKQGVYGNSSVVLVNDGSRYRLV